MGFSVVLVLCLLPFVSVSKTKNRHEELDISDFEPYISPDEMSAASQFSEKLDAGRYIIRSERFLKNHVRQLRNAPNKEVDLVFLVDNSGTMGRKNFINELEFVKKLLADFTVSEEETRVAVITFASSHQIVRHIDFISNASSEHHKCSLLEELLPQIQYTGGGTYTLGAMLEAQKIFLKARPSSKKALFLITDGYSNGGDPRTVAERLKHAGVEIFTFGIHNGNLRELRDMASTRKVEHTFFLESFDEFEALARRALHEDLRAGNFIVQSQRYKCDNLCDLHEDCCDSMAHCTCGTNSGHYQCICAAGFYGSGLKSDCIPCPEGSYSTDIGANDITSCKPCPDRNHWSPLGSTTISDCKCREGYEKSSNSTCLAMSCPKLVAPENGYFVKNKCDQTFHAVCGIKCKPGYALTGGSLRICQANRRWSGEESVCKIKRCSVLEAPRHGRVVCTSSNREFQSSCIFSCHNGYVLFGSRRRTCLAIAMWDGILASCRAVRCRKLSQLDNGNTFPQSCTRGYSSYDQTCQFSCKPGYTLEGPSNRKCSSTGHWSTNGKETKCIDTTPPIIQCPKNIITFTEDNGNDAVVLWDLPDPWDNSGKIPSLRVIPAVLPPHRFPIGTNKVKYIAKDSSKNRVSCQFNVIVLDKQPPNLDKCISPEAVISRGKQAYVTWDKPVFSDNSDDFTVHQSHFPGMFKQGVTKVTYTAIDASGNNSTCNINVQVKEHPCSLPNIPIKGNLTCNETESEISCTAYCREGNGFVISPADKYECSFNGGTWQPGNSLPVPDCSDSAQPLDILQLAEATFISDVSCKDALYLSRVESKFRIDALKTVSSACDNDVMCHVTDLKTECIPPQIATNAINWMARHKRSVHDRSELIKTNGKSTAKVIFSFAITGSILDETANIDGLKLLDEAMNKAKTTLKEEVEAGNMDHLSGQYYLVYRLLKYKPVVPIHVCRPGRVLIDNQCINCPVGTFFNVMTEECSSCDRGTYQPEEGHYSCLVCPSNTTTVQQNSKTVGECRAQCLPGSYSSNGLEPCLSCVKGYYQPDYAQHHCIQCPYLLTTWRTGARKLDKCRSICPKGYVSKTGLEPCFPCPVGHFQPEAGQTACFVCPDDAMTFDIGSTLISDCQGIKDKLHDLKSVSTAELLVNDCFADPCQNDAWCESLAVGYICHCHDGFSGLNCEQEVNECELTKPCHKNATCVDLVNDYSCECSPGYSGKNCQHDIDECLSEPCMNGGECLDGIYSYTCSCLKGFAGVHCGSEINECESSPCKNGATCYDRIAMYECSCIPGYIGRQCQVEINECESFPCQNNGTCHDEIDAFSCTCQPGFSGTVCDFDIDECSGNPCKNGATCVDDINSFNCECLPGFSGKTCEIELPSDFILSFGTPGAVDYVIKKLKNELQAFTVSFWMKTKDRSNYGTVFSYAIPGMDNALTIMDYSGFVLYVNGERVITDIVANDGIWHHLAITWTLNGEWHFFFDGILEDYGESLAPGVPIKGGGKVVIGQEQDIVGGGFSKSEAFVGEITLLNVWNGVLSERDIYNFYNTCYVYKGNVFAWSDFHYGRSHHLMKSQSNFCKGCEIPTTIDHGSVAWSKLEHGSESSYECHDGYYMVGHKSRICMVYSQWYAEEPSCERVKCGRPPSIKRGHVVGRGYAFGDRVYYSCRRDNHLVGNTSMICLETGTWSSPPPVCKKVTCTPPSRKVVWRIQGEKSKYYPADEVTILCHPAYVLRGVTSLFCQEDGSWSDEFPICFPARCVPPPIVANAFPVNRDFIDSVLNFAFIYDCFPGYKMIGNGRFNCVGHLTRPRCVPKDCGRPPQISHAQSIGNIFIYESRVTYRCDDGYRLIGKNEIFCKANGQWSEVFVNCERIYCPKLAAPENGVLIAGNLVYASRASYACKTGYNLIGVPIRTCMLDGTWTFNDPYCQIVTCEPPNDIPNGHYSGESFNFSEIVTYSCEMGYELSGGQNITCTKLGVWNASAPFCKLIECPKPIDIEHGQLLITGRNLGDTITYSCRPGYRILEGGQMVCQSNSHWHGTLPKCIPLNCPPVQKVENGHHLSTGLAPGSVATFYCDSRYKLIGKPLSICTTNGTWNHTPPKCNLRPCPPLTEPSNGYVNIVDSVDDSVAEYDCEDGYSIIGQNQRVCLRNGSWSFAEPKCRRGCPDPTGIEYIIKGGHKPPYQPGDTVTYNCPEGFTVIGEIKNQCLGNLTWSSKSPHCQYLECNPPVDIPYGVVMGRFNFFGASISYSCQHGFKLHGRQSRTCGSDGRWSGDAPKCAPEVCRTPNKISNGFIDGSVFKFNHSIHYRCQHGYKLTGVGSNKCIHGGKWEHKPPKCILIQCDQTSVSDLQNGYIERQGFGFNEAVHFYCYYGYSITSEGTIRCSENGTWSHPPPTCEQILCGAPPVIDNADIKVEGETLGSVINYECHFGFMLKGDSSIKCMNNSKWTNPPSCHKIVCKHPPSIKNGDIKINGHHYADTAEYSCNSRFLLVGSKVMECNSTAHWQGQYPRCIPDSCGTPPLIDNGEAVVVEHEYMSIEASVRYECDLGYVLSNDRAILCLSNGFWSTRPPRCDIIICTHPPPEIPHASVKYSTLHYGSIAKYTCTKGYYSRNLELKCSENRSWEGIKPKCEIVMCHRPKRLENGHIGNVNEQNELGSKITNVCDLGFKLVGPHHRICQNNSEWSGQEPVCTVITCPLMKHIRKGFVLNNRNTYNTTIMFKCRKGFHLKGAHHSRCEITGRWSHIPPVCRRIRCTAPKQIDKGNFTASGTRFEDRIYYRCIPGFRINGKATISCLSTGVWSSPLPKCTKIACPTPAFVPHGNVIIHGQRFNSRIRYRCNTGYAMKGIAERYCTNDGTWNGTTPTCQLVNCPYPDNIINGHVLNLSHNSTFIFGDFIKDQCNDGFLNQMNDSRPGQRMCTDQGHWTHSNIQCFPIICHFLEPPENSVIDYQDAVYGGLVKYSCSEGYILDGSNYRICMSDRSWSGGPPVCTPITCNPLPKTIENGFVNVTSEVFQSEADFGCNFGYEISGANPIVCEANGKWSSDVPSCTQITCPPLEPIENGYVEFDSLAVAQDIKYICNDGFQLIGDGNRTCQNNKSWTGKTPSCRIVICGPLPYSENMVIVSDGDTYGSKVEYSCARNYELVGPRIRTCLANRTWSGSETSCRMIECPPPPDVKNGYIDAPGYSLGMEVQYICQKGYQLRGSPRRGCQQNKKWSGSTPHCDITHCPEPPRLKNGMMFSKGSSYGSTVYFNCQTGYRLEGDKYMTCNRKDDVNYWDTPLPRCVRVQCPEPVPLYNGYVMGRRTEYGSILEYKCHDGYKLKGNNLSICLINDTWDNPTPQCVIDHEPCGKPYHLTDGYFFMKKDMMRRTTGLVYKCDDGYFLEGDSIITCHKRKWKGSRPRCVQSRCGPPPKTVMAVTTVTQTAQGGTVANLKCNLGYETIGQSRFECGRDGYWIYHELPFCRPVDCGKPTITDNMDMEFTNISYQGIVQFFCKPGFLLVGSQTSNCLHTAVWSSDVPVCETINCGVPEHDDNVQVTVNNYTYNGVARYSCESGKMLYGEGIRICLDTGHWNGTAAKCKDARCSLPKHFPHGQHTRSKGRPGDWIGFKCHKGYILAGNNTLQCQGTGKWHSPFPVCKPIHCKKSPVFPLLVAGRPAPFARGDTIRLGCKLGYRPNGNLSTTCQEDKTWSRPTGTCSRISCGKPRQTSGVWMVIGRQYFYKDSVRFVCQKGLRPIRKSRKITCQATGRWNGVPKCIADCRIPCQHGGTCVATNRCACPAGYVGPVCERANCVLPCLNGGTCIAPYKCRCSPGYTGSRCQKAICNPPCANGGTCRSRNRCSCPRGWRPPNCKYRYRRRSYYPRG